MKSEYDKVLDKGLSDIRKNQLLGDFDFGRSLINFIAGDFIGEGVDRIVFKSQQHKNCVVKIEDVHPKSNMLEWEIWELVKHTDNAKWFAPCVELSNCGKILVQKETKPLTDEEWKDLKVPTFFTDRKKSNFGKIGKQVVAHDYALCIVRFMYFGMPDRMIKASK